MRATIVNIAVSAMSFMCPVLYFFIFVGFKSFGASFFLPLVSCKAKEKRTAPKRPLIFNEI